MGGKLKKEASSRSESGALLQKKGLAFRTVKRGEGDEGEKSNYDRLFARAALNRSELHQEERNFSKGSQFFQNNKASVVKRVTCLSRALIEHARTVNTQHSHFL